MGTVEIIEVKPGNLAQFSICGYKNPKRPGYLEKKDWILENLTRGLRVQMVQTQKDGTQGMIEYVPGVDAWRPIAAANYMVIHCLFVGFKREYKQHGLAGRLLQICEDEARRAKLQGLAVVARAGSFMAGESIFIKHGFKAVDRAAPDFVLLAKPFAAKNTLPCFNPAVKKVPPVYVKGLYIFRAFQCPYTVANVEAILASAKKDFKLKPNLIEIKTAKAAQDSPCPFGTFGIVWNGKVVAFHPVSVTRFKNIMQAELNPEQGCSDLKKSEAELCG